MVATCHSTASSFARKGDGGEVGVRAVTTLDVVTAAPDKIALIVSFQYFHNIVDGALIVVYCVQQPACQEGVSRQTRGREKEIQPLLPFGKRQLKTLCPDLPQCNCAAAQRIPGREQQPR